MKQPITASVLNAGSALLWLKHDPPNISEAKETTNKIVESGKLAGEIIDRLRSLYTKALPKREPLALNEVIGEMIEMLRGAAMRYGVSVRANLANNLPSASADCVQIQQVLMNLMLNGIEAMHDTGGVLTVKSQSEDGQIKISVTTPAPGCRRARLAESSTRSLPPSRKAAAWAWPSANPSSNRMAAAHLGQRQRWPRHHI